MALKINMHKSIKITVLLLAVFGFSAVSLSACAKKAPDDVLLRAKEALVQLSSGRMTLEARLSGTSEKTSLEAKGHLEAVIKNEGQSKPMALDLTAQIDGKMGTPEKALNLNTIFNLISKEGKYYFKVDDFQTNEENLQFLVPLLKAYLGKWYRLSEDFIPPAISEFQASTVDTVKKKQLNDLFVASPLFVVETDHGIKKVDGHKTYHLSLSVNREGFKDYYRKAAQIHGTPFSEVDLEQLVAPLAYVKTIEVYIDTETYYIYRALVDVQNTITDQNPSNMRLELTFDGSEYNQNVDILIPSSTQDFNPLALPENLGLNIERTQVNNVDLP